MPCHVRHYRCRCSNSRSSSPHPIRNNKAGTSFSGQTRFGLHVSTKQRRVIGKFDFEEKYQEDAIYEELGSKARVWRANLDECEEYDNDMVIEARDGLDLLLVFAGLFSAILTTFVAQTSQALFNNFPAVSTSLLLEMVTLQRALINGTSIDNISTTEMTSGPSGFDIWVNALWFTSLTLSLGTALVAVLVKQWLYQYMSIISGTARDRSLIRFYRFDGLRKWHVLTIVGILPFILHVALGLFLAGLVIFLIPLNLPLAFVIGFITFLIYSTYTISNILPILYTQCPYRTPFSEILNIMLRAMLGFLPSSIASSVFRRLVVFARNISHSCTAAFKRLMSRFNQIPLVSGLASAAANLSVSSFTLCGHPVPAEGFISLKETERMAATGDDVAEEVACDALLWLYQVTSNPPTKAVILQSLGCLSDRVSNKLLAINADVERALGETIYLVQHEPVAEWSVLPGQEARTERLLRAHRHVEQPTAEHYQFWELDKEVFETPFHLPISIILHSSSFQLVQPRKDGSDAWRKEDLFLSILRRYDVNDPILLPPTFWRQLFNGYLECPGKTLNNDIALRLCELVIQTFAMPNSTPTTAKPFSGGVPINDATVPLSDFVVKILPRSVYEHGAPSEPLRQRLTINNFIVSNIHIFGTRAIPAITSLWDILGQLFDPGDNDVLCHRAEHLVLQVFVDGWSAQPDPAHREMEKCYRSVLTAYCTFANTPNRRIPSRKFFKRLLSDLCSLLDQNYLSAMLVSSILRTDISRDPAFYILLCESPLFSSQIVVSMLYSEALIYPILTAFVAGLARGHLPSEVTKRCIDYLCADPDRLFTVCRILALGGLRGDDALVPLLQFARIIPNHTVWMDRAHYMSIDLEDWPLLRLSTPHEETVSMMIKDKMQTALRTLDVFFASLQNHIYPDPNFDARMCRSTHDNPPIHVESRWQSVLGPRISDFV